MEGSEEETAKEAVERWRGRWRWERDVERWRSILKRGLDVDGEGLRWEDEVLGLRCVRDGGYGYKG